MKQTEQIEHKGIVAYIGRDFVRVSITVNEACGSCASRKACAMGSSEKREIVIYTSNAAQYSVGEEVNVLARQSIGVMAVLFCYVVPLIVLVVSLICANIAGCSDGYAAAVALGSTAIYYGILGIFHKRISKKVIFTISKL